MLLECHHLLPDEVGRQNPWVLFQMLDDMQGDSAGEEYTDEYLNMFYGREVE